MVKPIKFLVFALLAAVFSHGGFVSARSKLRLAMDNLSGVDPLATLRMRGLLEATATDEAMPAEMGDCSSIADLAVGSPDLTTLVAALQASDLIGTVEDPTAVFTVLAPTDSAFEPIPMEDIDSLLATPAALDYILSLHVIPGAFKAADFAALTEIETLAGEMLTVSAADGSVTFTGPNEGTAAAVTEADLMSCAGVVHKIDTLIIPGIPTDPAPLPEDTTIVEAVAEQPTAVVAAVTEEVTEVTEPDMPAPDADVVEDVEIDAPVATPPVEEALPEETTTGEKCGKLKGDINPHEDHISERTFHDTFDLCIADCEGFPGCNAVAYQELDGSCYKKTVDVETAMFSRFEYWMSYVVCDAPVVDSGMPAMPMPAPGVMPTNAPGPMPMSGDCPSILDIIEEAGDLYGLLQLSDGAGFVDVLMDPASALTVLGPVDGTFSAIPAEDLRALIDNQEALLEILSLHVIEGLYKAGDFMGMTEVTTLGGAVLGVEATETSVTFTGPNGGTQSMVIEADIMSCAGVVHKIDTLIIPGIPQTEEVEEIAPTQGPPEGEPLPPAAPLNVTEPTDMPMPEPMPMPAPTPMPMEEGMAVSTAMSSLGDVLVDSAGMTLYGFLPDGEAGAPTCNDGCVDVWPPLIMDAVPEGLGGMFTLMPRADGTMQLAAGKWPLYLYAEDATAGDVNGQGVGDVWYAVAPDGMLIGAPGATVEATPEEPATPMPTTPAPAPTSDCETLADIVTAAADLTTLVTALDTASLTPTLMDPEAAFTILAPADTAFEVIPMADVEALLANSGALNVILNLHIIPGALKAADLAAMTEVTTADGLVLGVAAEGGSVTFTGPDGGTMATVTEADITSCAGVVHKIDSLLIPGVPVM